MALAYVDHSVARTHASADQNVARTRCEPTQLQGCILYTCVVFVDTCSRKTLYMMAMLHACYIWSCSHRIDLFACMTQTTAAGICTIRTQPGRPETTHALPQAIRNELSKPDLDAKTQKLHLPSFVVCKQPKSEKKSDFTLQTPHFTLLISHCFLHTPNLTLHTSHFTRRSSHSKLKLHTPHFSLLTSHCFLHTAHFTLHSTPYTSHCSKPTCYKKTLRPKWRKSANKSMSQPSCSQSKTIYKIQLQKTLRMQPKQEATLTQPFQCDLRRLSCKTQEK